MLKIIFIYILLFFVLFANAQKNILSRKITITIKNTEITKVLQKIGHAGDVKFSYNSEIINGDSIISIKIIKKSLKKSLDKIFKNSLKYKIAGNHVILQKKNLKKKINQNLQAKNNEKIQNPKKQKYIISGIVTDYETGNNIKHVSIYDIDEKYSVITNSKGYYSLTIDPEDKFKSLNYSKQEYYDTVIVLNVEKQNVINLSLKPKINIVKKIEQKKIEFPVTKAEERFISEILIPEKTKINTKNLEHIDGKKFFQLSLFPRLGTNLNSSGIIVNNLSLNILAGYSKGLRGLEIGSLLNIIKENAVGVQISGIANIVGNKMAGIQFAGITNVNTGKVYGIQASAVNNTTIGTINGVQISGLSNVIIGEMRGIQISGFNNFVTKNVAGGQFAAIINVALGEIKFCQFSGFANYSKINKGIQFANFLNFAKENRGLQIGLINISDTASGISLGLFNYVRKGYRAVELNSNEIFITNLTFKSGANHFYNIYNIGARFQDKPVFSFGLGFGSKIKLSKRFSLSQDITSSVAFMPDPKKDKINIHSKFSIKLDFNIFKSLTIFAGPNLNIINSGTADFSEDFISGFSREIIYETERNEITTIISFGFSSGIRF